MTESVKPRLSRAEQARATRRRIIAAAAAQFVAHGYGATLLDQVAEQAGVAVQTVYFHFGNKRTLLKEALDLAAAGDDAPPGRPCLLGPAEFGLDRLRHTLESTLVSY